MAQLHTPGNLCNDFDCLTCMNLDLNATILANGGQAALDRINGEMQLIGGGKVASVKTYGKTPGTRSGRGIVRGMSAKQINFATKLINTRDTSNLILLKGWTLDIAKLNTISLAHARAFIDALLACPEKQRSYSVKVTDQGSDKQKSFLRSLMADTNLSESDVNSTYRTISDAISSLIKIKAEQPKSAKKELSEGLYNKNGILYRLKFTRSSGQLVAYRWTKFETPEPTAKGLKFGEFVYEGKRPLYSLTEDDRMSLEEAMAHGMEFHYCCVCGIELTNPDSQAEGIGPICKRKF
jgi:hypothetical protein